MAKINGRWDGKLLDASGFEGFLSLHLKASRGKVSGVYEVALVTQHGDAPRQGKLAGSLRKDIIELTLVPDTETDPKISLKGDVFVCNDGLGMKGVYSVEARKYSPLVSGVIVLSTEGARVIDEEIVNFPGVEQPPAKKIHRRKTSRQQTRRAAS